YTSDSAIRTGVTLRLEALLEHDGFTLYQLRDGQIPRGFGGGPLLNRRTRRVCAMIHRTRDIQSPVGGYAIPVAIMEQVAPGLLARNESFHEKDSRWTDAPQNQQTVSSKQDFAGQPTEEDSSPSADNLAPSPADTHTATLQV